MKSAEEWLNEVGLEPLEWDEVEKLILKVQSDALKAAAWQAIDNCVIYDHGNARCGCDRNGGCKEILSILPEE